MSTWDNIRKAFGFGQEPEKKVDLATTLAAPAAIKPSPKKVLPKKRPSVPPGIQTTLPTDTPSEIAAKRAAEKAAAEKQYNATNPAIIENSLEDVKNYQEFLKEQELKRAAVVRAAQMGLTPKEAISEDEWNTLSQRTTKGVDKQRETLKEMEELYKKWDEKQNVSPLEAIVSGFSDIVGGTKYVPGLTDRRMNREVGAMKFKDASQKAAQDLSESEYKLLKEQFQDIGSMEKLRLAGLSKQGDLNQKAAEDENRFNVQQDIAGNKEETTRIVEPMKVEAGLAKAAMGERTQMKKPRGTGRPYETSEEKGYGSARGKDLAEFETKGLPSIDKAISELTSAKTLLARNPGITGGAIAALAPGATKFVKSAFDQDLKDIDLAIKSAASGTINETLRGSISDADLKFILSTNFDMAASPRANMQVIQRKIDILERAKAAKIAALKKFKSTGSSKGAEINMTGTPSIRKQVNKKTGAVRYVDQNGNVVKGP